MLYANDTSAIDNTSATWLTQLIINWGLFTFALPFLLTAILRYVKNVEASVCKRGEREFSRLIETFLHLIWPTCG